MIDICRNYCRERSRRSRFAEIIEKIGAQTTKLGRD